MRSVEGDPEMSDGLKVGADDDDAGLVAGTSTAGTARGVARAVAWRRGAEAVAGTLMALVVLWRERDDGRERKKVETSQAALDLGEFWMDIRHSLIRL